MCALPRSQAKRNVCVHASSAGLVVPRPPPRPPPPPPPRQGRAAPPLVRLWRRAARCPACGKTSRPLLLAATREGARSTASQRLRRVPTCRHDAEMVQPGKTLVVWSPLLRPSRQPTDRLQLWAARRPSCGSRCGSCSKLSLYGVGTADWVTRRRAYGDWATTFSEATPRAMSPATVPARTKGLAELAAPAWPRRDRDAQPRTYALIWERSGARRGCRREQTKVTGEGVRTTNG